MKDGVRVDGDKKSLVRSVLPKICMLVVFMVVVYFTVKVGATTPIVEMGDEGQLGVP